MYNIAYNISARKKNFVKFLPDYHEREPKEFGFLKKQTAQNTVENTLQTNLDLANKN